MDKNKILKSQEDAVPVPAEKPQDVKRILPDIIDPASEYSFKFRSSIPQVTVQPSGLPGPRKERIWNDGSNYWLYVYVNGAWRSQQLGITQASAVPAGTIIESGASATPSGYLPCDGAAVSRTTYATLFTAIGTAYGAGDMTTTFNVPDKRGRVGVGKNAATFSTLGATGGEETHTLTLTETPSHAHTVAAYGTGSFSNKPGPGDNSSGQITGSPFSTSSQGSDGAHNNLQPYQVFNYYIKT